MKLKKLLSASLCSMMCMSCLAVLPVTATTYDPCDVNHDGTVNMLDVVTINQFLLGAKYYTNYNQLDANQSHTIDSSDSMCVMKKVTNASYSACYIRQYPNAYMQPVAMPAVSSTITLDDSANETAGRTYKRYSYTEGKYLEPYTLTPTNASLNAAQNTQTRDLINGDDNRGVAHGYENTGIVYLHGSGNSTGFIVGDHQIATAAHCVANGTKIYKNIEISTYDRSGIPVEGGELTVAEIHIPEEYTVPCTEYDYALITVEEDLSDYVQFKIGNCYNMTSGEVGTIPIHITGRPGYIEDSLDISNTTDALYTHQGSVYGSNNRSLLYYYVDTSSGQSGSPVYTITRERYNNEELYTYTALAIHTAGPDTGYNFGTLMTKYHLQFYGNNPNISY